jgi:hypothetical protein
MISNIFPSTRATLFEPLATLQVEDCDAKENNRAQYEHRVAHIWLPDHPPAYAFALRK